MGWEYSGNDNMGNTMTGICLATALCDPEGELLDKARYHWMRLSDHFDSIAIHVTTNTHDDWFGFLESKGIPIATAAEGFDSIGLHRRRSLALALESSLHARIFYADIDHVLRWAERYSKDLDRTLKQIFRWDCLVVGRSQSVFAIAPRRLRDTESVVNHIYSLVTGDQWDLMMAARGLSPRAARLIVDRCEENTLGNDVAWPLFCRSNGLSVGYTESEGLRYETNRVYATDGQDSQDSDPQAWMLRVKAAAQHIEAMRSFL